MSVARPFGDLEPPRRAAVVPFPARHGDPVVRVLEGAAEVDLPVPTAVAVVDLEAPHFQRYPLQAPSEHHARTRLVVRRDGVPLGAVELETPGGLLPAGAVTAAAAALDGAAARRLPLPSGAGLRVSVVIVTRDRPDVLRRCVRSVLDETGDVEVIVVDSAPRTDTTRRAVFALDDPRLRYVLEERAGEAVARERGAQEATGHAIAFLPDDLVVDEHWTTAVRAALAGGARIVLTPVLAGLLDTRWQHRAEQHRSWAWTLRPQRFRADDLPTVRSRRPVGPGRGVLVATRGALRAAGPVDAVFGAGSVAVAGLDADHLERLLLAGGEACYEPAALCWWAPPADHAALRRWRREVSTGDGARAVAAVRQGRGLAAARQVLRGTPSRAAALRGVRTALRGA